MFSIKKAMVNRYDEQAELLLEKVNEADAVMVGGASGMSAAAGYAWYAEDPLFRKYFGRFIDRYGITGIFDGLYYHYETKEERWAFLVSILHFVNQCEVRQTYQDLRTLLQNKDFFVVTTNQDTLFSQTFGEDKVSTIQGDWRYFQCAARCHDKIYPAMEAAERLYAKIEDCRIPTDEIPKCPVCGGDMEPWVRSFVFLEGRKYHEEYDKWTRFLQAYKNKKILFLELGVGRMTPMFIQEPFWNMTYSWRKSYYVTINPKDAILPKELQERGMAIHEDIALVLRDAVSLLERR